MRFLFKGMTHRYLQLFLSFPFTCQVVLQHALRRFNNITASFFCCLSLRQNTCTQTCSQRRPSLLYPAVRMTEKWNPHWQMQSLEPRRPQHDRPCILETEQVLLSLPLSTTLCNLQKLIFPSQGPWVFSCKCIHSPRPHLFHFCPPPSHIHMPLISSWGELRAQGVRALCMGAY